VEFTTEDTEDHQRGSIGIHPEGFSALSVVGF
jgi:hypothetical protein